MPPSEEVFTLTCGAPPDSCLCRSWRELVPASHHHHPLPPGHQHPLDRALVQGQVETNAIREPVPGGPLSFIRRLTGHTCEVYQLENSSYFSGKGYSLVQGGQSLWQPQENQGRP